MTTRRLLSTIAALSLALGLLGPNACASGGASVGGAGGGGGSAPDAGSDAQSDASHGDLCPTTFTFQPAGPAANVRIAGEWQGFDLPSAPAMNGPDASGAYSVTVDLAPGLWAYKVVVDRNGGTDWILDPAQGRRKWVGGVENSAIKVRDCHLPSFTVKSSQASRPSAGQGTFAADLHFNDGIQGSGPDTAGFEATLVQDGTERSLGAGEFEVDGDGNAKVSLGGLADGKYRVVVTARSKDGSVGEPLRLVFWIEAEPFSWKDAVIYMIVTDRYRDGDPSNNAPATAGADARGDWKGGDLEGVRQSIADGTLDALGVRALWLTPFYTNPAGAYLASDGIHEVAGYHGYWPTRAREVDPRIGGEAALRALVAEAHEHGIRILQDFVLNHIHEDHEYKKTHPEWFRTGCVCGTAGCDWTEHALDCMFASYLPDIDHTVPEANAAFVGDAVHWLDAFDLDGLRVDAVKHVEEVATRNLAAEVREGFEAAGTRYFLMGETAMGWSDCADPCNDPNYDTISRYIGPFGLDGQFDFVLYHGVSYRTFAWGEKGMLHADYWLTHGLQKYPPGAIMTPYIGSHDTARFVSLADYRGQDAAHDKGIPGNQWDNTAVAPDGAEPYARARIAMAWLLSLPGAPLLYYGDEYGQWGGADPNNRLMWRSAAALDPDEAATLALVKKLGAARRSIPALRRGTYSSLSVNEDTLVFARFVSAGQVAIVGLTRAAAPQAVTVDAGTLGIAAGTVMKDAIGGPGATVAPGGQLSFTVPAGGVVVLAP